jgi:hypothetical protein
MDLTIPTTPSDDELFEAFHAILTEGNEELACLVYAGVVEIPDHLRAENQTKH